MCPSPFLLMSTSYTTIVHVSKLKTEHRTINETPDFVPISPGLPLKPFIAPEPTRNTALHLLFPLFHLLLSLKTDKLTKSLLTHSPVWRTQFQRAAVWEPRFHSRPN